MYSTIDDVKALTGTNLDDVTIAQLINEADADINNTLSREGLSITGSTPSLISQASKYLASALVLQRGWASGATPEQYKIGDFSRQSNVSMQIERFEQRGRQVLQEYIRRAKFDETLFFTIIENKTNVED